MYKGKNSISGSLLKSAQHFCFAKATLRVSDKSFGAMSLSCVLFYKPPSTFGRAQADQILL